MGFIFENPCGIQDNKKNSHREAMAIDKTTSVVLLFSLNGIFP